MAPAWADTATGGWFCAGIIAVPVPCSSIWDSTWTAAETEIDAGTGGGTAGPTDKSRPAAVVSASNPILQRGV